MEVEPAGVSGGGEEVEKGRYQSMLRNNPSLCLNASMPPRV